MIECLIAKGVAPSSEFRLLNWLDIIAIYPLDRTDQFCDELGISENAKVALYSGKMDAKQGIEVRAAAASVLAARQDFVFAFCGNGATRVGTFSSASRA